MSSVTCETHGPGNRAFVCQHLVQTLRDEIARGAYWGRDEDGCINGYCRDCAERLETAGGEWRDDVLANLGVQLICEQCFSRIASINGFSELD